MGDKQDEEGGPVGAHGRILERHRSPPPPVPPTVGREIRYAYDVNAIPTMIPNAIHCIIVVGECVYGYEKFHRQVLFHVDGADPGAHRDRRWTSKGSVIEGLRVREAGGEGHRRFAGVGVGDPRGREMGQAQEDYESRVPSRQAKGKTK